MSAGISKNHVEESISLAHVYAIAGKARMIIEKPNFDYGVDGRFASVVKYKNKLIQDGVTLPFQLKATKTIKDTDPNSDSVPYSMKREAYDRLWQRNNNGFDLPQILLVCQLATEEKHWVSSEIHQLTLQKCCYFHKFLNMPEAPSTLTIFLERKNLLTPDSLIELLDSVKNKTYSK